MSDGAGKGSKLRPEDKGSYHGNFDEIFKKKHSDVDKKEGKGVRNEV